MSDYLRALAGKTLRQTPVASPRIVAMFEDAPMPSAGVTLPDVDAADVESAPAATEARRAHPRPSPARRAAAEPEARDPRDESRPAARPRAAFAVAAAIDAPEPAGMPSGQRADRADLRTAPAEVRRPPAGPGESRIDDPPRVDPAPTAAGAVRAVAVPTESRGGPAGPPGPQAASPDFAGTSSTRASNPPRGPAAGDADRAPTTSASVAPIVRHDDATPPASPGDRRAAAIGAQPPSIVTAREPDESARTDEPPPRASHARPVAIAARFSTAAAVSSPPMSRAAPTVHVTIGRIEVAAAPAAARAPKPVERGSPRRQTLDEYLDARRRPDR